MASRGGYRKEFWLGIGVRIGIRLGLGFEFVECVYDIMLLYFGFGFGSVIFVSGFWLTHWFLGRDFPSVDG